MELEQFLDWARLNYPEWSRSIATIVQLKGREFQGNPLAKPRQC